MKEHKNNTPDRMKLLRIILFLFTLASLVMITQPQFSQAGISRLWAVDDGEKIKKTDNNHPLATSADNPVWDGRKAGKISLFGAKNEVIAFQLIIEADNSGVNKVDVSLDSLTNGSYVIKNTGSSDPFDYVGKRIELFTENYVIVKDAWYPDALIPFAAPSGLGGAPFDIAADNNQGIWVDIYIPRDAPPGIYTGDMKVSVDSVLTHTIPVSLEVYDFTLPDECHLKNMFFLSRGSVKDRHGVRFESPEYYAIEARYHQMAHRHRFDIVRSIKNLGVLDKYHKRYFTGKLYTPANNYEGPGENVGNRTFSIGVYNGRPSEFSPNNEAGWRAGSDAWVTWFKENAPNVEIHKYLRDEPWSHGAVYDDIIERCEWIHNNPGPGRELMTYVTCPVISQLQGHCDFWSLNGRNAYLPDVAKEQAKGKKCGFYNGVRPYCGEDAINTDAIDWRVQPWICRRYDLDQYFYWETTNWGYKKGSQVDVLNKNRTDGNGYLFYPGEDAVFPKSSRQLPGPLCSIRIKNWRRGMQDYEYLWLAGQSGLKARADAIVKSCVPAAFNEADKAKGISWPSRGYGFERYRRRLANLISGKTVKPLRKAKPTDSISPVISNVQPAEKPSRTSTALDLVGLWHFDEGSGKIAKDSSKYGNDGTLVKGPTWVDGKFGKALQFDGVDDSVNCGNPAGLKNIVNEITFMAWVKPFRDCGCIVRKWEWSDYSGYHFDIYSGIYDSTFNLKIGYGDISVLILGMALRLNEFSHVAFTADDSEVIFYINGRVAGRILSGRPIQLHNSKRLYIGGGSGWTGKYFQGIIDEVKIYGRVLTAKEIAADYQAK